ncbi:MAG TPA: transposase [Ktedonobacteraceae bacterium]|nr:transposase [Ktedonobacteraceae bacterium]
MMGTKQRNVMPLIHISLEDLVPKDHFYRQLDEKLDLSFVYAFVQERYAKAGRPSIDPVVFFKLQLVMFFEGIRSERQLMDQAAVGSACAGILAITWMSPFPIILP